MISIKMRTARLFTTAIALFSAAIAVAQLPPVVPVPAKNPATPLVSLGIEALQNLLDVRQYHDAVREAFRLLALRGPAAGGLNRFQVMLMKGYAQIGSKSTAGAIESFRLAIKETTDPREISLARWTAELFQRSHGQFYTPVVNGAARNAAGPIDLLNADGRAQAFELMLDSELSVLSPKIKAASTSLSLVKIWPVVQQVESLAELDVIASGNEDKVRAVAGLLLDHSRNLLTSALKEMWVRTGDIDTHANVMTTSSISTQDAFGNTSSQTVTTKNGLTDANRQDLSSIIATCNQIHDAADAFAPLSADDKTWLSILADSDRVSGRASDVLHASYGVDSNGQNANGYNPNGYNSNGYNPGGTGGYYNSGLGVQPLDSSQLQRAVIGQPMTPTAQPTLPPVQGTPVQNAPGAGAPPPRETPRAQSPHSGKSTNDE